MEFTYSSYEHLIELLKSKGYFFSDYFNYKEIERPVIFRHDVDFNLYKALKIAELEKKHEIKSTYFILISSSFYNVYTKESFDIIKQIKMLGHDIGLHFDEKKYDVHNYEELNRYVQKEKYLLENLIDEEVSVVSMHRPSRFILENDINFPNILNTYSNTFFNEFKYTSDSRMSWREDILSIVEENHEDRLHVLTHPFWYSNKKENIKEKLMDFINNANKERYLQLSDNFKDIQEFIKDRDLN
ncbi:hypothetical protein SAMN04488126_102260 [Bhargavaea beijingensis]|uniref:Polysaccharide deacetylase n=1 Tax=Bhargavaea beijingensis TaxID=426756 RepID=A0A1G6ZBL7_9BACL|nr:hypothetical protein [Bhargavaea beijingensis]SDD99437.1 hypothetical protein SAMN04488126_102260 [Bhargavaea beijingensis]